MKLACPSQVVSAQSDLPVRQRNLPLMGPLVPYSLILEGGKAYQGQTLPFLASLSLMTTEQNNKTGVFVLSIINE
jgi:hypothetical protein